MSIPSIPDYPMPRAASAPANKTAWRPEPRRALLLIHDMQRYFLRFYDAHGALRGTLVRNLQRLHAWAHAQNVPVVYTAQPHEQPDADRALLIDMWGPGLPAADPAQQAIIDELAPQAGDQVLAKWRYSAFQRSALLAHMHAAGRDQLIIGGVYAHRGCMATALEAFMLDIQAFLAADAVADFSADEHNMALRYVATRCGHVMDTDAVVRIQTHDEVLP